MPTIRRIPESKLTVRRGDGVAVAPPTGSPAWWAKQMVIDHGAKTVLFRTRASSFTFEKTEFDYTFTASEGINIVEGVTPTLPGTDGREFPVDLVAYSEPGAPRTLRAENANVAAPFGVEYVEFFLYELDGSSWVQTAPRTGGTYSFTISFRQL